MAYAVYVNHIHGHAKIHNVECRYYVNRKDPERTDEGGTGYWKAPFDTVDDARALAERAFAKSKKRGSITTHLCT